MSERTIEPITVEEAKVQALAMVTEFAFSMARLCRDDDIPREKILEVVNAAFDEALGVKP